MKTNYIKKLNFTVFNKTTTKKKLSSSTWRGVWETGGGGQLWLNLPTLTLLDAQSHYSWVRFGQFPFSSKLPLLKTQDHYIALIAAFKNHFSLLSFYQVNDLKHWKNTCWQKLSNWSWQPGRAREKWHGWGKNRTIVKCFINSLGFMEPYLYRSRVFIYNILILNLTSDMHLRCRLWHLSFQLNKLGKTPPQPTNPSDIP